MKNLFKKIKIPIGVIVQFFIVFSLFGIIYIQNYIFKKTTLYTNWFFFFLPIGLIILVFAIACVIAIKTQRKNNPYQNNMDNRVYKLGRWEGVSKEEKYGIIKNIVSHESFTQQFTIFFQSEEQLFEYIEDRTTYERNRHIVFYKSEEYNKEKMRDVLQIF